MTEAERFFQACWSLPAEEVIRYYTFGTSVFRVQYATEGLASYFHRAIAHLETSAQDPDLSIKVTEGKTLSRPFWNWDSLDSKGNIPHDSHYVLNFQHWHGLFQIFDPETQKAFIHIDSLEELPQWYRSFSFRSVVDWYFQYTDFQPVHSACVSRENRGVLIVGQGGSGKSTTALACLQANFDYLGDDFILADSASATAFSLYNVAKIDENSQHFFQGFGDYRNLPGDDEKVQLYLTEQLPEQMAKQTSIKAILVPKVVNSASTEFHALSHQDVLQALAPSTLELLNSNGSRAFQKMARMCRNIPGYAMHLSRDMAEIPNSIAQLLDEL